MGLSEILKFRRATPLDTNSNPEVLLGRDCMDCSELAFTLAQSISKLSLKLITHKVQLGVAAKGPL